MSLFLIIVAYLYYLLHALLHHTLSKFLIFVDKVPPLEINSSDSDDDDNYKENDDFTLFD